MNNKINPLLLKYLHRLSKNPVNTSKKTEAGFNLLEVVTVVIIVGILSAIVAPAWDAFVNRQRLRAAQNTVFQAMQSAHAAARGTRSSWQVSFRTGPDDDGNDRVWVALHSANSLPAPDREVGENSGVTENAWYPLAKGVQIYAEDNYTKNLLEVVDPDTTGSNKVMDGFDRGNTYGVLFNYSGCPIVNDGEECTEALDVLTLPMVLTFEHERLGINANRCVIVQTLIGSMRTAEGEGKEGCQPDDNL
jgi:prepilin-type N-terminal cleavage/methylation domain-containing protein